MAAKFSVSRNAAGIPPRRASRSAARVQHQHLEATALYSDGRSAVERVERNDAIGRREMDKWAGEALARPEVVAIHVYPVARIAGYLRSGR